MAEPLPRLGELQPGSLFAGRYQIDGLLGRGGMGAVYRVRDFALGEPIALKVLVPGDGDDRATLFTRFRQEVRLARRVTHPNVARVYDLGEIDGVLYLTMELVEGGTLRTILQVRRLPFPRAASIGAALAAGLQAAHAVGVVHRDLKPSNVLLDPHGRVVISDFGVARGLGEDLGLTVGAIGTPSYMAPEQLAQAGVEPRTDLYALGLILHEMIVGERPRHHETAGVARAVAAHAPEAVAAMVERCLAATPADRPTDAAEVREVLEAALAAASRSSQPPRSDDFDRAATVAAIPRSGAPPSASRSAVKRHPERGIAVLPLRYRGAPEHEYLREALGDELVDQLSRTRGLRVFSTASTAHFRDERDPRSVGRELGADFVVDGVVQREPERSRATLRLLDAATGVQIWSERVEAVSADGLTATESIARKIAERLRVEIGFFLDKGDTPNEAIEACLHGRRQLHVPDYEAAGLARDAFARCLALAPNFAPAYPGHAIAALRCAFFFEDPDGAIQREADASVERALAEAADLPETQLAAGIHASHGGEYACAVKQFERAVAIAPNFPDAHEQLAMLECEGGRPDQGIPRMKLAIDLDPSLASGRVVIARAHAFAGEWDACFRLLDEVDGSLPATALGARGLRLRALAWRGDRAGIERALGDPPVPSPGWNRLRIYGEVLLGQGSAADALAAHQAILTNRSNPRFVSFAFQLLAEVQAACGDVEGAIASIRRSVDAVLIDLEWLRRCPLLDVLRSSPAFSAEIDRVRVRTRALWR